MRIKIPSIQLSLQPTTRLRGSRQNHRQSPALRALRWFWRFSEFYGEYSVRSPQERQQWLKQQYAKHQQAKHQQAKHL